MNSRPSVASFAQQDASAMLASIIDHLPTVPSDELADGGQSAANNQRTVRSASVAAIQQSKRLAKLKQKLDRQNNFMVDLKRKIREKEAMKPKADSDREELAFLRNRLQKEVELQRKLLADVVAEQRQDGNQWQSIRLCPDKLDEYCANPWTIGSVPVDEDRRFSLDSTLSALSSDEQVEGACPDSKLAERFEKELMNRDRVIEILQGRLERLTTEVRKVRKDNEAILDRNPRPVPPVKPQFCQSDIMHRLEFYRTNAETLGQNLEQMEQALQCIQKELGPMGSESECPVKAACTKGSPTCEMPRARKSTSCQQTVTCDGRSTVCPLSQPSGQQTATCDRRATVCPLSRPSVKQDSAAGTPCPKEADSQKQYAMLLQEYTKKTTECRQLCERLAKAQAQGSEDPLPEDTERELLKKRCSELLDEQDEFRVLMREQATQLDDYRARYLAAQQQVEEQRLQMSKLQVTNQRVEKQINFEIDQIKRKFQDKLRELTPYPRLLEEQEAKVDQLKRSNETLFAELERTLRQMKVLEDRLHEAQASKEAEVQRAVQQVQTELEQSQDRAEALSKEKQFAEEEAVRRQRELDELRAESAMIITRANQRLEQERDAAQQKYRTLEGELAQCRAEASFTIANREQALKEMHTQIKVLSASFDDAQMQIRSFRNQLAYLQNEKLVCLA